MASDVTTYDAALKEVYASIPSDELNNATPLYDRIQAGQAPADRRSGVRLRAPRSA